MNKSFFNRLLVATVIATSTSSAGVAQETTAPFAIPLTGSTYTHPDGSARVYFLPAHTGDISVQLKAKSAQPATIIISLDGNGKTSTVRLSAASGYTVTPAGSFPIKDTGYHFFSLKRTDGDKSLPDIAEIQLDGPAAKDIRANTSQYKGAPATHLSYPIPGDSTAAWFYTEINIPKSADQSPNAYYETNGFSGGYMGIQLNNKNERRVIFSIWSNYRTDDPKQIPSDYAVNLIKKGKDVFTGEFGNEGSGGHSHLIFMWKPETTYKLLVNAKPAGDHTIYTAWYFAPENGEWKLVAKWDKTKTGGKLLSGLYSFVENFGDNGEDYFTARYGNQWICTPSGTWIELTKARFSTTANKVKHPRFDYGAGLTPVNNAGKTQDWFYMFSGGFKKLNNCTPGDYLTRTPTGIHPDIDFSTLPQ